MAIPKLDKFVFFVQEINKNHVEQTHLSQELVLGFCQLSTS